MMRENERRGMLHVWGGGGGEGDAIQPLSHEVLILIVAAVNVAIIFKGVFHFCFQTAAGKDEFLFLLSTFGFFL